MTPDEAPRVGVYICHCGGNISDVVDVEQVVAAAAKLPGVVVARENLFMCSDPGQGLIADDIEKEGLNRVVVAACSPSLHELTFRGTLVRADLNAYLYEHANIREQVSWCSKSDPVGATEKAIRLTAAAVAKARVLRPLDPIRISAEQRVTVIGGGVAGLTCARDLAERGLEVDLVEKSGTLGGRVAELGPIYPTGKAAREVLSGLIAEVTAHPGVHILLNSEVTGVSGSVGAFELTFLTGEEKTRQKAGAIVIATGFDPYQPRQGEFGYGEHPGVITLPELTRRLDPEGPTGGRLSANGQVVRSVTLIHCVGNRQVEGIHEPGPDGKLNEHCSRICCTAALHSAGQILERFPGVQVFDVHQDIRTYGRGQETIHENAARGGVLFVRHRVEDQPEVVVSSSSEDAPLTVRVKDMLTYGEVVELPSDLVVLVTGMVPRDISGLVEEMKLPRSPDGFLQEVHPKLRPVELSRDGVLIAGTCQAPMDISESCSSASAAAAKVVGLLIAGDIELSPFAVDIDLEACDSCGKCVEECRFVEALALPEGASEKDPLPPNVNLALCRGCGMCSAVCPTGALTIRGWQLDQYEAMVDAIVAEVT
jgi:heterodisulfide reductase subunit A2